jgi:cell division inhibitor SepF
MSMLRSVLTYMGLGPDEDYDDGYLYDGADTAEGSERGGRARSSSPRNEGDDLTIDVRDEDPHSQRRRPDWLSAPASESSRHAAHAGDDERTAGSRDRGRRAPSRSRDSVRPLRAVPPTGYDPADDGVKVRAVPAAKAAKAAKAALPPPEPAESEPGGTCYMKPHCLSPQSFGDAKTLADDFKSGIPVIMNLQEVERDLARRLIDFASGICYALDGGMEKVASQVFLLTPSSVEVSDEDRAHMEQRGYE